MAENLYTDEPVPSDDDLDDIEVELHSAGREVTFGFSDLWPIKGDVWREIATSDRSADADPARFGGRPTRFHAA